MLRWSFKTFVNFWRRQGHSSVIFALPARIEVQRVFAIFYLSNTRTKFENHYSTFQALSYNSQLVTLKIWHRKFMHLQVRSISWSQRKRRTKIFPQTYRYSYGSRRRRSWTAYLSWCTLSWTQWNLLDRQKYHRSQRDDEAALDIQAYHTEIWWEWTVYDRHKITEKGQLSENIHHFLWQPVYADNWGGLTFVNPTLHYGVESGWYTDRERDIHDLIHAARKLDVSMEPVNEKI